MAGKETYNWIGTIEILILIILISSEMGIAGPYFVKLSQSKPDLQIVPMTFLANFHQLKIQGMTQPRCLMHRSTVL